MTICTLCFASFSYTMEPSVRCRLRDPFLEGPETFSHPKSHSKISNLMITELCYSRIPTMIRRSLHTRSLKHIHLSVFRYRLIENGFTGPKMSGLSNSSELKYAPLLNLTRLDCPQYWVLHGSSCYLVIDIPTANWSDARTTWQNLGGDLAIIRSQDENNFTLDLVMKQKQVTFWGAWLGLHRNPSAGDQFYWIDDTPLAGQFSA